MIPSARIKKVIHNIVEVALVFSFVLLSIALTQADSVLNVLPLGQQKPDNSVEQRLSDLEQAWQRLTLSGDMSLSLGIYQGQFPGKIDWESAEDETPLQEFPELTLPGLESRLHLQMLARVTQNLEVSAKWSWGGLWGVRFASDLPSAQMVPPTLMTLDELTASYYGRNYTISAGRQIFSMGPIGLLVKDSTTPIDSIGLLLDMGGLRAFALIGRLSSEYYFGSDYVIDTDDYSVLRLEKSLNADTLVGYNQLISGISDESGQSVDIIAHPFGKLVYAELAHYRQGQTITDLSGSSGYAFLGKAILLDSSTQQLTVSYGRADKGFTPAFSSIRSSGGASENLVHNAENVTIDYARTLKSGIEVKGLLSMSKFIDKDWAKSTWMDQSLPLLEAGVTVSKYLSPNVLVSATLTHSQNDAMNYRRLGVEINMAF